MKFFSVGFWYVCFLHFRIKEILKLYFFNFPFRLYLIVSPILLKSDSTNAADVKGVCCKCRRRDSWEDLLGVTGSWQWGQQWALGIWQSQASADTSGRWAPATTSRWQAPVGTGQHWVPPALCTTRHLAPLPGSSGQQVLSGTSGH